MKTSTKEQSPADHVMAAKGLKGKTVRGSGFTYSEEQKRTDLSMPIAKAGEEEIVELPDLGQKSRP